MNTCGARVLITVVNDTVYYATRGEYDDKGDVYLFGVSIYGGAGELLVALSRGKMFLWSCSFLLYAACRSAPVPLLCVSVHLLCRNKKDCL